MQYLAFIYYQDEYAYIYARNSKTTVETFKMAKTFTTNAHTVLYFFVLVFPCSLLLLFDITCLVCKLYLTCFKKAFARAVLLFYCHSDTYLVQMFKIAKIMHYFHMHFFVCLKCSAWFCSSCCYIQSNE